MSHRCCFPGGALAVEPRAEQMVVDGILTAELVPGADLLRGRQHPGGGARVRGADSGQDDAGQRREHQTSAGPATIRAGVSW